MANNPSLSSLLKNSTLEDHEEVLKASNAALSKSKTDLEAQRVKAVALLKLDRYDEAAKFFDDEADSSLKEKAALEYAYTLYKVGRLEEAVRIASSVRNDRGGKHVEAQARYRLEDSVRTAEIYADIRKQHVAAEEYDIRVNQGAIDAQSQWLGFADPSSVKRPGREDLEAFETAYNAACGSIARGEVTQAEMLLKRAKELCKHSDDLTPEQKAEELLPIAVQQIYVLYRLGKTQDAEAVAEEITIGDIPDLSTRAIAQSNLVLLSQPTNPYLALKEFNSTPKIPESDKLFSYQSIPLSSNAKTIELRSFKFDGVASSTKRQLSKQSSSPLSPEMLLLSVFNAAAHARNEVGKGAITKVLPELERRPNDIGLIITMVQMYVATGNHTSAIELMESLFKRLESSIAEHDQDLRYNPGLISILVALYRRQGRKLHVQQELAKAAVYWRQKPKPPVSLLRAAGIALLLQSSDSSKESASQIFEKLREIDPNEKTTIAGYVASHASSSDPDIKPLADKLTRTSELIRNVDIDALENAGIPQSSNALAIAQATSSRTRKRAAAATAAATEGAGASKKRRTIRKSRLPKNFDANSTSKPDPERWLPLRDRSTYRPPKGKRKGGGGKKAGDDRTQGGVVSEELDIANVKPSKAGEVVTGGGEKNKKKGKGKR